jgi:aryl-alcohol dehydrogenase-like predicted oxidoreductase
MRYQLLGRSGLKVSEICFGAMGLGTANGWGANEADSFAILDAFAAAGGNFIDTANIYQQGQSEAILGNYLAANDRDFFVIATKYSLADNRTNPNASGNNRKNMMRSVEGSLKRLKTDFIDVLYLHIWDDLTPVDEILRGLDDLVRAGKVNYIAISDTPAWIVSKSQTLAELMGWSQFVALQVEYSLLQRTPERELLPMAKHYGLTLTPWAPLAGGALTGKYLQGGTGRLKPESNRLSAASNIITQEVVAIANELGVPASHVALQWTRQQGVPCIPIVGATKLSQLTENIAFTQVTLTPTHLDKLEAVSKIDLGFPGKFFQEDAVKMNNFGGFYDRIIKR